MSPCVPTARGCATRRSACCKATASADASTNPRTACLTAIVTPLAASTLGSSGGLFRAPLVECRGGWRRTKHRCDGTVGIAIFVHLTNIVTCISRLRTHGGGRRKGGYTGTIGLFQTFAMKLVLSQIVT